MGIERGEKKKFFIQLELVIRYYNICKFEELTCYNYLIVCRCMMV